MFWDILTIATNTFMISLPILGAISIPVIVKLEKDGVL